MNEFTLDWIEKFCLFPERNRLVWKTFRDEINNYYSVDWERKERNKILKKKYD